jgi:predicted RNA methylase
VGSRSAGGSVHDLRGLLAAGGCPTDATFDRHLPAEVRAASRVHWTPTLVATEAARWLDEVGARTVVDLGSGTGKFGVVAALAGAASHVGVEQRPWLVAAARQLARRFGVDERVTFVHGVLTEALPAADAYYLFNPLGENILDPRERLDEAVELSAARWARDVRAIEDHLIAAPVGTFVLIYNGFGGEVPGEYALVRRDLTLPNELSLWRRR